MLAFRFLVPLLVCLAVPLAARGDGAADLLAKHKAFTGWQFGDSQTKLVTMTETVADAGGKALLVRNTKRIGALYRIDTHDVDAGTDSSSGFTGRLFWYSDENGFTVPIIGDTAKVLLARDLLFTDGLAELPWTNLRTENRWNKSLSVVRVEQVASAPVDLYIDPDTGAYAGAVIDPKGDNEEIIHVLDYQAIGAMRFIQHWKYEDSKNTRTISAIKLGAQLTGNDLRPPAQSARWEFKNATPFPIRMTIDRIVITARVNGVEGNFLLDSGAGDIFLSGAFARRAGLRTIGHGKAFMLYEQMKTDVGKADTLEIGGNVLHNVNVYFGTREIDTQGPDGLMGFDLLAGTFATIDFEKKTLQIQDPAAIDVESIPGVHIAVDLSTGTPATLMYVQDKAVAVNATLDTGDPRYVLISQALLNNYGLHFTAPGYAGECGLLDNMSVGPFVYERPTACVVDFGGTHDALVGYDFLKGLGKLHFDYGAATMILTPVSK